MLKLDKTENNSAQAAFLLSCLPPGVCDCMNARVQNNVWERSFTLISARKHRALSTFNSFSKEIK